MVRKKLKRDKATEGSILGLIDHTHATAAKNFEDAIMRDGFANHGNGVAQS